MKVCIVRNAESRTNASMIRVLDALLEDKHECILLTRSRYKEDKGINRRIHNHDGIDIDNYEVNIKAEAGKGLTNIFQLIHYQIKIFMWFLKNKDKYEVIHSFDLDSGLPVMIASKILKRRYVYHIADFYIDSRGVPQKLKSFFRNIEYKIIKNAETIIICTEERKEQIKGSKPKKIAVVHNTPSLKDISTNFANHKNKKITFTYVGGLTKSRFIKNVIDTFTKYPDINLELAGMGELSDYAKKASLKYDNIYYHGMMDYNKALELNAKGDIMFAIYDPVVPNHKYSAPNKVYEAMRYGKPIIVAKGTGIDKLVEREKMGISIDYTNESFEEVLKYISTNINEIKYMGKRAKMAYDFYSWCEMKKRIINIYRDINNTEVKL